MDEVLSTKLAYRPGSGYFGWQVSPVAKIVKGDAVNSKQKVIEAINYYETQRREHARQGEMLTAAARAVQEAERELTRTLKAVYGDRASKGVILRGKRYCTVNASDRETPLLHVEQAEFEVLG